MALASVFLLLSASHAKDQPNTQRLINSQQAARFLAQSTFGPTEQSIRKLVGIGSFDEWLRQQFSAPISLQLPYVQQRYYAEGRASGVPERELDRYFNISTETNARHDIWWHNVLTGEDQLRQRVTLALSEILVVSDHDLALQVSQFGMAHYYDTLARHAFGNYRELLEAVTLHPVMGRFLSTVRNERNDPSNNKRPDENFAREVLQLFSLGVSRLRINGTPVRRSNGTTLPSYSQKNIIEYARIFTGWNYANISWGAWDGGGDTVKSMVPVERYHEPGRKRLINGRITNGTARVDLEAALDSIFYHRNVGPYISKLLIKRLVTSNPTGAYVRRVARVFNNNGQDVRGDLRATVRAILLDPEARNGHNRFYRRFGKLREPLLRITHCWRAFPASPTPGSQYGLVPHPSYKTPFDGGVAEIERIIGQGPLRAPSVFNFFLPDYAPPGLIRDRGLVAPEFQIATESSTLGVVNLINSHVQEDWAEENTWTYLDLTRVTALASNSHRLLNHLNLVLLSGQMTVELRRVLMGYLNNTPLDNSRRGRLGKARDVISLVVNSPEYLIQK